jgi:transposase
VLTGVLNIQTGSSALMVTERYTQVEFQLLLTFMRRRWRGWHIVLFIDKHSAHRADRSRRLARRFGIELRWLPKACPELNPVDHLWRHLTREVLANEPTPTLDGTVKQALDYWWSLTPRERLRQAGVLSPDFWLSDLRH